MDKVSLPPEQPMLADFSATSRLSVFRISDGRGDIDEDVLFGYLMSLEADEMGIVISDKAVEEHINRVCANPLPVRRCEEEPDVEGL